MSQTEALRMTAEVVDRFTGPLGNLKRMMADLAGAGTGHNETLERSFGKVTGGMRAAEQAAASGLNPALKAIGITSLTAGAAVLGVGAALKSFASGAASIGQLARDTNINAQQLREVQGVLGKVGVDAATSGQALQQFAEAARLARNGVGPIIEFLTRQGRTAEGRAYFQNLAKDIRNSRDAGEALDKALKGMEGIKDPVERRLYAENVLKMGDAARLIGGPLGTLQQQFEKFRATNGVLSPKDIENAEKYQRALGDLGSTMSKLGTSIAIELAGPAEKVASALAAIVANERGPAMQAIRQGLGDIRRELESINWAEAGKDGLTFLREGTALATSLARALHQSAEAIRSMRESKKIEALRHLDGASGPLARRLAPMPGDDVIERQEQADALRGRIGTAEEQRTLQAELLKELEERGDKVGAIRLREAMEANTRHLKSLEEALGRLVGQGGATVQQQSFGGAATVGAMIRNASLGGGGMPAVRALLRGGGGIYAPGGGGGVPPAAGGADGGGGASEAGPGVAGRALRRGGGDRLYGRDPGEGGRPESGAGRSGRALRGEDGPTEAIPGALNPRLAGSRKSLMDELDNDPGLKRDVIKTASMENRGSPQKMQAVIESMVNRAKMNGYKSLRQAIHSGFYGPVNRGGLSGSLSEKDRRDGEAALDQVRRGSNAIGYRTDQGMLTDPGARRYMREADHSGHRVIGGENFFYMGQKGRDWARRQEAEDAAQSAGSASAGARNLPSFADALKERAKTTQFGSGENEAQPINPETDTSLGRLKDDLKAARAQAEGITSIWGGEDQIAEHRSKVNQRDPIDPEYKPEHRLRLDEIRQKYAAPKANGIGFRGDYLDRQAREDQRRKDLEFRPAARNALQGALRGGAAGATQGTDRNLIDLRVHNPGPNTHVTTDAKGPLFREIQQTRGRQMQPAGTDT